MQVSIRQDSKLISVLPLILWDRISLHGKMGFF